MEFENKEFAIKALDIKRHQLKQSMIISSPYKSKYDDRKDSNSVHNTRKSSKNYGKNNKQDYNSYRGAKPNTIGSKSTLGSSRNIKLGSLNCGSPHEFNKVSTNPSAPVQFNEGVLDRKHVEMGMNSHGSDNNNNNAIAKQRRSQRNY